MNLSFLRKAFSTVLLSMFCTFVFAQTATGVVKDRTGEPMIGVSVIVKGTTNAAITDIEGKFTINDVQDGASLVVSYIGYLTQEIKQARI